MTRPKQSVRQILLAHLVPNPANVRDDVGDLTELTASIVEHGVIEPLSVTEHPTEPDRWLILAGERRHAAAQKAGLRWAPCVVRHNLDADCAEQTVVMLVENVLRTDLSPVEKAKAFGKLRDEYGLALAEISRRTGFHQSTISQSLTLLDLDDKTLEAVARGDIRVGQAVDAVRKVRRTERRRIGHQAAGRPVVREPGHFTGKHPLAEYIAGICDHSTRPKVGGVGCGQCWEAAIRDDVTYDGFGLEPQTSYDEAAVLRRLDGDKSVPITKADRIEIVRRARLQGRSYRWIQAVAGITKPDRYASVTTAPTAGVA